jgi:hypothetical protein
MVFLNQCSKRLSAGHNHSDGEQGFLISLWHVEGTGLFRLDITVRNEFELDQIRVELRQQTAFYCFSRKSKTSHFPCSFPDERHRPIDFRKSRHELPMRYGNQKDGCLSKKSRLIILGH